MMISENARPAGQVLLIPSEAIYPNPNQPRKVFNQQELINLAISIRNIRCIITSTYASYT